MTLALAVSGCVTEVELCERRDYTMHLDTVTFAVDSLTHVVVDTVPAPPGGCPYTMENAP